MGQRFSVEPVTIKVVGEICKGQFRLSPCQANRANKQSKTVLLVSKHMFHCCTD